MLDANDLLVAIKKASLDVIESVKPVNMVYGKIEGISPLKVNIENKLTLTKDQLIVSDRFKIYEMLCEVEGKIGIAKYDNTLKSGEDIILLRMQGGQQYVVIDRVVK